MADIFIHSHGYDWEDFGYGTIVFDQLRLLYMLYILQNML